jgi:3-hydroxyacyl-[acyl-carrier-protein] dehydratase
MLIDNLFRIQSFICGNNNESLTASIILNPDHPVFKGHFPGNPILPGVCTLQIAKELLEKLTGMELMLLKANSIKYLGFVNPLTHPVVNFTLTLNQGNPNTIQCSATVTAEGSSVCSFKGEYGAPEVCASHNLQ